MRLGEIEGPWFDSTLPNLRISVTEESRLMRSGTDSYKPRETSERRSEQGGEERGPRIGKGGITHETCRINHR